MSKQKDRKDLWQSYADNLHIHELSDILHDRKNLRDELERINAHHSSTDEKHEKIGYLELDLALCKAFVSNVEGMMGVGG